ncbi:MAG: L-histidine N(alpha)-methyltransferase, partial [Bacteroidota bacterium]|nr:L-histidine N(alpha)-methyltransferase [Bacteroidota bacterium]
NISLEDVPEFCKELRSQLSPGDMVLIGMDLKKNPKQILAAYNDRNGFTREFNLNLLRRINNELGGNFNVEAFDHYASYDPLSGACRSFLVSLADQQVKIGDEEPIYFYKDETIFMEISQKYTVAQADELAVKTGFIPVGHFFDKNKWFVDVVWRCV